MKILWITGWAVPPAWFSSQAYAVWPEAEHRVATPTQAAAAIASENFEALGGYSLGALWLLVHVREIPKDIPVILLAPIFAFTAEENCGGKVAHAQLRLQRRRLRKDAVPAVNDFFQRAGMANSLGRLDSLSESQISDLDEELGWLENWKVKEAPPQHWCGFVGAEDPLLDAVELKKIWPDLQIIARAGHAPGALLCAAKLGFPLANPKTESKDVDRDLPQAVIQNFNCSAAAYETHGAMQAALAAKLASWIAPEERTGNAVEFGAGTGLFTRQMSPWKETYTATDAAPNMVELGRALYPSVHWKVLNAHEPSELVPVDWLFACNVLQWLEEPETVLHGWRKILTSGGRFAVAILLPGTLQELRAVLPEASPLHWHSEPEWREMFTRAGLTVERAELWEHVEILPNSITLLRTLHAMGLAPRRTVNAG
ncbi:MAG TPA: methyltransferase, partial [Opitutales bacterium]|nr:methyltransferase [Opitutales bacterium]